MKKSDLKTGMRVELRDGGIYIVLKDCETWMDGHQDILFIDKDDFLCGTNYNENLLDAEGDKEFDIIKIYQSDADRHYVSGKILNFDCPFNCIWTRDEETNDFSQLIDEIKKSVKRVINHIEEVEKQICKKL